MARKLKGTAIQAGTISVTQLDNSVSTVIQTGGGPKITAVQVTDASWAVLDDTAVDTAGGNIVITGTGFVSGCLVYIGQTPANSVGFVSSTQVRVNIPALTAGTYPVYLSNPDGGTAIRLPGVTTSANPAWQTGSALPEQYDGVAITLNLVATEATSYTLTSGSLPPGLSLNTSTGAITGTVTGVTVDTTYTFTVRATDAQLQDSPRTFTVTITVSDAYFRLTTLLLSGSALSANTVIRDSSTNNFNLTVSGDARASNFTPYGTGWSTYFSSTSGLTISGLTPIGSGDLTIETFVYMTTLSGEQHMVQQGTSTTNLLLSYDGTAQKLRFLVRNDAGSSNLDINSPSAPVLNQWFHFAGTVQGTTGRMWINGNVVTTGTVSGTRSGSQTFVYMGDNGSGGSRPLTGYLSNTRIVVGTAVYTANFSPTTTNLSSVSGTSLLTNQSNRFINLVGNVAATISQGSPRITSFNPFNITNTGVNGSMYFDGTGDYLSRASTAQFAISTSTTPFTVECWAYPTAATTGTIFTERYTGGANTVALQIGFDSGSTWAPGRYPTFGYYNGSSWALCRASIQVELNAWTHIAYVFTGSTSKIYINGEDKTNSSPTPPTSWGVTGVNGDAWYIGGNGDLSYTFTGYISDLRFINGTAVYTANFTAPTQPLTDIANTQLLTLQYDQPSNNHTFLDSSSNQFLITRNGNATQGTFSPFSQSGWSVYINNGTSSQIRISDNAALRIGTSAFTIESWVYPTGFSEPFYVLRKRVNGNLGAGTWAFTVATNGSVLLEQVQGPATIAQTSAGLVALNTWTHVAVSRDSSNNVKIFVNGTIQATATSSYNFNDASNPISLLCDYDGRNASSIGYASNLRFVIGSAVYTANFTPATSNLTSSSQGAVAADVKILTFQDNRFRDASTNNFSITISGSPSVQAFSPFAATAVYSPAVHGGSAYVNATSTYLALPASTPLVNIADWTVDFWMYPTSYVNAQGIFGASNGGGASLKIAFQINGSSITLFKTGTGIISISQPTLNQWTHLSIVRSSSTGLAYIFVNGVLGTSGSFGSEAVTSNFQLFTNGEGATSGMYGYLSSFRVSNIARQITAFTVPTQPYQADTNTILLTNFTDSAILDSTGRNTIETVADAKTSSVVTKFTGGSMYFDGTGDWIITSQPPSFYNLPGNFTIEFWIYIVSAGGSLDIMGTSNNLAYIGAGQSGWVISWSTTAGLRFGWQTNNTWSVDGQINSTNRIVNAWAHIAVVRNGSTITGYVNGLSTGSTLTSSANLTSTLYSLYIGAGAGNQGGILTGYLSDIRITQGYARYTANFTAPTAPARLK